MTTETLDLCPQLRSDLVIEKQGEGKMRRYLIIDPASNRYFQCGEAQYVLLALFTGELTRAEIITRYSEQTHIRLRTEQLDAALGKLAELKFLVQKQATSSETLPASPAPVQRRRIQWRLIKRWPLYPAWRILQPLEAPTRWLFSLPVLVCCGFLALATWWIMAHGGWSQGILPVLFGLYSRPSLSVWGSFLLAILLTAFIHECAHALTLQHFGRRPGYFGVGLALPVGVFFYAEISEIWRLTKRHQRILVTLAGPLASLLVGAVGALAWWVLPFNVTWSPWLATLMTAGVTTALVNLVPFLRTDGYFALADWVGIPNLDRKARAYMLQTLLYPFPSRRTLAPKLARSQRILFAGYGVITSFLVLWLVWIVGGFLLRSVVPFFVVLIRQHVGV